MAERTARLGYMHYRDTDGRIRDAVAGEAIHVHPDDVERFDSLNVLLGQKPDGVKEEPKQEPVTPEPVEVKPRRGRPRKVVDKS